MCCVYELYLHVNVMVAAMHLCVVCMSDIYMSVSWSLRVVCVSDIYMSISWSLSCICSMSLYLHFSVMVTVMHLCDGCISDIYRSVS